MTRRSPARPPALTRRALLAGIGGVALSGHAAMSQPQPAAETQAKLAAAPAKARLRPAPAPETEVWAFDGRTPGPRLSVKQGGTLRLRLENGTASPLSLHWLGMRGAAAMDGVGGFSQPPVAPGASFDYVLTPPDSGSFLYRPLVVGGSSEPAGRGLAGLLVVEETEPPEVALDLPVVVSDWLLGEDNLVQPFTAGSPAGAAAGRLGSWLTVNGGPPPQRVPVAPGAKVRLRLANACNARIMRLRFDGAKAVVIAVDSQPSESFEPVRSQLPFAPGTRYDLLVDMPEETGATAMVTALVGPGVPLLRLVTEGKPSARKPAGSGTSPLLRANPALPAAVRLQDAVRPSILIEGGARMTAEGKLDLEGVSLERPWRLNGGSGSVDAKPLFSVKRGTPIVLAVENRTAFFQPIHVHGHSFRLLHPLDDGWEPYFLDTVQVPDGRRLHIAFIADNPGRWLISSTVLERFDLGLWSWFEVT